MGQDKGRSRHEQGRVAFSRLVRQLLLRNGLSHKQLKDLAAWANPEGSNWLSTSQISYLRTGRLKAVGPRTIDALAQLNLALAMLAGEDAPGTEALRGLGRPPKSAAEHLDSPWYLRNPETGLPMDAGDLYRVWIGRLDPASGPADAITDTEAVELSGLLADAVHDWARRQNLTMLQAKPHILQAYPVTEQPRQERLMWVLSRFDVFTGEQAADELQALATMVGRLRGVEITPEALLDELYARGDGRLSESTAP